MRLLVPLALILCTGCGAGLQAIIGWNREEVRHTATGEEEKVVTPRAWGMLGTGIGETVLGLSLTAVGSQPSDCDVDDFGFTTFCYRSTVDNALLGAGLTLAILGAVDVIWGMIRLFAKPEIIGSTSVRTADVPETDAMPPPMIEPPPVDNESPSASRVVAVMDAEGEVGRDILRNLSDQIRVFIGQQGTKTIDRSTQERAFKDRVRALKKESYRSCYDDSCQLELGKALAASHIVRSRITKFGARCVLNGELIDLTSEVTVKAASAQGNCKAEGFLEMSEAIARQLMR